MAVRAIVAKALAACLLSVAAASPAFAQHVVTDSEAGKLTFDALTATPAPVFHRVAYRQIRREAYLPSYRTHTVHAVSAVSYRHAVRFNTGSSSHTASARHRHQS